MLSAREIVEYVYGPSTIREKNRFSVKEARKIGNDLGIRWDSFDVKQFALGLNVELEHGRRGPATDVTHDEPLLTGKIALAHLTEIPDYYTRLVAMEKSAERKKSKPRRAGQRGLHLATRHKPVVGKT
ncbi:MAG: DUF5661 family protein [Bacteroidota bacterium]